MDGSDSYFSIVRSAAVRRQSTSRFRKCSRSLDSHGYPYWSLVLEKLLPSWREDSVLSMKGSLDMHTELKEESSRTATYSDFLWKTCGVTTTEQLQVLAPMGLQFWEEMKMPGRFVPELWIASWTNLLQNGLGLVIGLTRNNVLKGAIGGALVRDLNDHAQISVEQFWFVTKEARGHGMRLLGEYDRLSRLRGAERVLIGHIHTSRSDLWHRILAHKGYRLLEQHYVK